MWDTVRERIRFNAKRKPEGFVRTGYALLMQGLKRALGLFVVRVGQTPVDARRPPRPDGVDTELLSASQMRSVAAADPALEISASFLDDAQRRGHVCVLTRYRGEIAGYGWTSLRRCVHTESVHVVFGEGYRYNFKAFTLPWARGKHLRGHFGALDAFNREHQISHSVYFIETHNFASLRAARRNGGTFCGYAGYLLVFGKLLTFRTRGAAGAGFAFVPAASEDRAAD